MRLLAWIVLFLAFTARANTLYVSNGGTDDLACGTTGSPCRSISQAIHNAGSGDTVIVAPGSYGDVDSNGTFNSPGDEAGPQTSCGCLINIDKTITLLSTKGADVTVINGAYQNLTTVLITANGTAFGAPQKGFTVTGGNGAAGVRVSAANDVKVAGIRSIGNTRGFQVTTDATNNTFTGNVAILNDAEGFRLAGFSDSVLRNVITDNGDNGVTSLEDKAVIVNNVVTGNGTDGIQMAAGSTGNTIERNSTLANTRFGIFLAAGAGAVITRNNIYGNNAGGGQYANTSKANCGIGNDTGGAVVLDNNFFGGPNGPGNDPADLVCDFRFSTTTSKSVATKEIKVRPLAP
jgi:parallel beta-helix repeat protein